MIALILFQVLKLGALKDVSSSFEILMNGTNIQSTRVLIASSVIGSSD